MDYKIKETLKKEFIEQDIKEYYKLISKQTIALTVFVYLGFIFLLFLPKILPNKNSPNIFYIMSLVVYIILLFAISVSTILLIIKRFTKNIKYTIVVDTLTNIGTKHEIGYGIFGRECLCFRKQGKFLLQYNRNYYSWSEFHQTNNDGIKNRSIPGDKFYLILINKKIFNVYNQKMFELSDELKCGVDNGI